MNLNENIYRLKELIGVLKEGEDKQSEQLKSHIDSTITGGSDKFTDIDLTTSVGVNAYSQICQKFIRLFDTHYCQVIVKMKNGEIKKIIKYKEL